MGDLFYRTVRTIGRGPVSIATSRMVRGAQYIPQTGPAILASSHLSYFDVPALIGASRRPIDWLSITELMSHPAIGWFFRNMNAFPVDRSRHDSRATRTILDRLGAGRLVGFFPEGRIRRPEESVINGGSLGSSVLRLARASGAPVIPAVVLGGDAMSNPLAWLPTGQARYGVAFGEPIFVPPDATVAQIAPLLLELKRRYRRLAAELRLCMIPRD